MAKTIYKKKIKNGKEYYFYRLRHENLKSPKDIYGNTVKELETKIKIITKELDHGVVNDKALFETFFSDWLFEVKFNTIKPSTKEKYEGIYRNYIKNSPLSKIKINKLALHDIQDYYNYLYNSGTSANCIKSLNKLIAPCIRYAYNNNLLIKDFTHAIVLPKEDVDTQLNKECSVIPFTLEEQQKFIEAIKGHELEMLFITALNTGLRQGELFALTWNDINFELSYVIINKTFKKVSDVSRNGRSNSRVQIQPPKTKNSNRKVVLPKFLCDRLRSYKNSQSEYRLKLGNLYENNNLVFPNAFGKYLDSSNVRKRLNKIIDEINANEKNKLLHIKHRKFHDLRHTYATRLFELGEEPKTVQMLLGHSDISVTLNTYTHVLDSMKKNAISKLDLLFNTMK